MIVGMESNDDLTGTLARLPDGQLVTIETVHSDGYASVRRIDGEWSGMIAVCAAEKLEPVVPSSDR
jgi:hypothetical protein